MCTEDASDLLNKVFKKRERELQGLDTSSLRDQEPLRASQVVLVVKNQPANARNAGDVGSVLELERSPGGGHSNPLQYSCLEKPMDRGAWWATVHRVTKNQTPLSDRHTQINCSCIIIIIFQIITIPPSMSQLVVFGCSPNGQHCNFF